MDTKMSMDTKSRNRILTTVSILLLVGFVYFADNYLDLYIVRILNVCAIYAILGMSMNLINGFTGLFSLGMRVSWRWGPTPRALDHAACGEKQIFTWRPW